MSVWTITALTVLIIAASAFFVIVEFSLLAARRHRIEESAETSGASRAALRNLNELTLMLAGAQLGITVCTFALGAITKPAVHYALTPVFEAWNMPLWVADGVAFSVALLLVTFLHLVVGEMAPKSWAIAHPEFSTRVVAVPARVFMAVFRPLLSWINGLANRLVAATGVEPVDRAAAGGYDSQTIRHLVEHSTSVGALDERAGAQITSIIELENLTVDHIVARRKHQPSSVPENATVGDVQKEAQRTGHLRILVAPHSSSTARVIHVRDTLLADPQEPADTRTRPALTVDTGTSVYEAFQRMRSEGEQLAVIRSGPQFLGVITWNDVLTEIWPEVVADQASAAR